MIEITKAIEVLKHLQGTLFYAMNSTGSHPIVAKITGFDIEHGKISYYSYNNTSYGGYESEDVNAFFAHWHASKKCIIKAARKSRIKFLEGINNAYDKEKDLKETQENFIENLDKFEVTIHEICSI